jgi:hypothetical protein
LFSRAIAASFREERLTADWPVFNLLAMATVVIPSFRCAQNPIQGSASRNRRHLKSAHPFDVDAFFAKPFQNLPDTAASQHAATNKIGTTAYGNSIFDERRYFNGFWGSDQAGCLIGDGSC